ncbi:MAG: geranylgeranylglyceryl/heptaprenylglyceryl phosphate synthase [Winogradskyella sp.]|nr:MAG: geranylgeranylglyceryl/heptaprenylglyceryl phosphate synthase [Winogradskyella sp.]
MNSIYHNIKSAAKSKKKLLAVLIDPDKMKLEKVSDFINKANLSIATHIFVGGSTVEEFTTEKVVIEIKKYTKLPVVLFPGDVTQLTEKADGLLFLSLISGRNPEYLVGKHVDAASKLWRTQLEVIPTGYLLIDGKNETAVARISNTSPMATEHIQQIINTAKAGEFLGMKLIYLEAGSGAKQAVDTKIISEVKKRLNIPLIVGGGIRTKQQIENAYKSGADMVVIGTAFEENEHFFEELKK